MPSTTTIKVPRPLRDRLAARAKRQGSTLAGVIEQALDDADDGAFWRQVHEDNSRLSDSDRETRVHDATLRDDLIDEADDQIAPDEW